MIYVNEKLSVRIKSRSYFFAVVMTGCLCLSIAEGSGENAAASVETKISENKTDNKGEKKNPKNKKQIPYSNTLDARLPFVCSIDESLISNTTGVSKVNATITAESFLHESVILGRPTDVSISVSILPATHYGLLTIEYGESSENLVKKTEPVDLAKCQPETIELHGLSASTQYYYRISYLEDDPEKDKSEEQKKHVTSLGQFHTARASDETFSFAVHADPHLGSLFRFPIPQEGIEHQSENSSEEMYAVTMANTLSAGVDFMIDLGDTFMTEKNMSRGLYESQYSNVNVGDDPRKEPMLQSEVIGDYAYIRNQFAQAAHSVPLFLAVGNHEAEVEKLIGRKVETSPAAWADNARKELFPAPTACEDHDTFKNNGFYSGNEKNDSRLLETNGNRCHDSYYAWEWGDAQFIVLDPMWQTTGDKGPWGKTLGQDQYNWLAETLESSESPFKFVFLHYLVGGFDNKYGSSRAGALLANYYEWGGCSEPWEVSKKSTLVHPEDFDTDNSCEQQFEKNRPGWGGKPIQTLLIENGVQIVFHGHDHLYVYEQHPNGIVYQEVPKPSDLGDNVARATSRAANYNYDTTNATNVKTVIDSNSGFLMVTVNANLGSTEQKTTTVEYRKSTQDISCTSGLPECYTVDKEVKSSYEVLAK